MSLRYRIDGYVVDDVIEVLVYIFILIIHKALAVLIGRRSPRHRVRSI